MGPFFMKKLKRICRKRERQTAMIPTLSIRIPAIAVPPSVLVRFICAPLSIHDYKSWTSSDYERAYQYANETPFTWDDVDIPRRSHRLVNKDKKNYKL
jgi:hypothetical protein